MPRHQTNTKFPSLTIAAELIPEYEDERGNRHKWEIVEDVPPSKFKISDLKFLSFLKKGKSSATGKTMRRRAVAMKGNLGLADVKYVLEHQAEIPVEFQNNYLVFPGTLLRDPYGLLCVAYLYWGGGRWYLFWYWLSNVWDDDDRLVRCK